MDDGFDIGLLGVDMPGSELARSMAAQGISLALCPQVGEAPAKIEGAKSIPNFDDFLRKLKSPRTLILRGTDRFADAVHASDSEDLLIDASDSWFHDSILRANAASVRDIQFISLGLGRNENSPMPLLMPAGKPESVSRARPFGKHAPRLVSLGDAPVGHLLKMTHAAIDNAFAEAVREIQILLERGLGSEAGDVLRAHQGDGLIDYLRSPIAPPMTNAGAEMGRMTVRAAHELGVTLCAIEAASGTGLWRNRQALAEPFCQPHGVLRADSESLVCEANGALAAAAIMIYAEAIDLVLHAVDHHGLHVELLETLRVWRSGVKWRGGLIDQIICAFETTPCLRHLLNDDDFSEELMKQQELLRHAVWQADEWNIPTPALAAALHHIDSFRGVWLPMNLVQPHNSLWNAAKLPVAVIARQFA